MSNPSHFNAVVSGTGTYLPQTVLTNADLEKKVDTNDEWIRARTGICERRIAGKDECSSTMAAAAARQALAEAGLEPRQLDLIIVATSTPDIIYPSTGCFVQRELKADRAAAFDVSAVCTGFVYASSIAEQFLKMGRYEHILVVGSEVNSRIMDWEDRTTCILFGDGAGAMVFSREEKAGNKPRGILSSHIYSDGGNADLLCVPGGIGRSSISHEALDQKQYTLKMVGNSVFKAAVKRMAEVALEALQHNGLKVEDIDLLVPHQANKRIIDAVGEKLGLPPDKIFCNIDKYGNTAGAAIPIAIHEAKCGNRIRPGGLMLVTGLGAGLTWGAMAIRW